MTQEEEIEKEADKYWFQWEKLTKREYFAALALQGILANSQGACVTMSDPSKAKFAVIMADYLIAELNETKISGS